MINPTLKIITVIYNTQCAIVIKSDTGALGKWFLKFPSRQCPRPIQCGHYAFHGLLPSLHDPCQHFGHNPGDGATNQPIRNVARRKWILPLHLHNPANLYHIIFPVWSSIRLELARASLNPWRLFLGLLEHVSFWRHNVWMVRWTMGSIHIVFIGWHLYCDHSLVGPIQFLVCVWH